MGLRLVVLIWRFDRQRRPAIQARVRREPSRYVHVVSQDNRADVIRELARANEQGGQSPLRVHSPTLIRTLHLARALG
jgi:hypothetical protein